MKIIFIGTVYSSKKILEKLLRLNADIVGIITKKTSAFNADFADLSAIANRNSIPYRYAVDVNAKSTVEWIKGLKADIIFCFGLSQILKKNILRATPMGVVGFHPAKLPQNRGRHPIVWALALGLEKTASTFFLMDEGVDSGDILSQVGINITYADNAMTLYEKITNAALSQIEKLLPQLADNNYKKILQDSSKVSYWRKRNKRDGEIDFRMNGRAIYNLIRSLTRPYIGAHILYKGKEIKVWEAKEVEAGSKNTEYGKVLSLIDGQILVKCYEGAILLTKHEFKHFPKIGEYLL